MSPDKADSYTLTARIANFIAKMSREDEDRLQLAIKHVLKHVDFSGIELMHEK